MTTTTDDREYWLFMTLFVTGLLMLGLLCILATQHATATGAFPW
jgi:hypothetical protein